MDPCTHDLLYEWAFCSCPMLLNEPDAFDALHRLVRALILEFVRNEREKLLSRVRNVSAN